MDDNYPFWDGEKCVQDCPNDMVVNLEDTACVTNWCTSGMIMMVEGHGRERPYKKCTTVRICPFVYQYNDEGDTLCMAASICRKYYSGYPYDMIYECISAPPENLDEFEEIEEVYTCKKDTYLFYRNTSTRCYTKQACSGFIFNGRCEPREFCNAYWYENDNERECLKDDECRAKSPALIPFDFDIDYDEYKLIQFCISIEQCPAKGGYFFGTGNDKTCVNATACSKNDPKGYAYEATKECSAQEPDTNGNFHPDEMKKNIYKCDANHEYLDTSETKTKCVT